ncbi:MAG: type I-B CRISPR-associated protein Cas5b, partial [Candidatus Thorarchaeota archaeon]
MKVVAFDVSSPLAQFRKGYSTTSTLTFSIAPPSAVRGLIGAILGMTSAEIPDRLAEAKVGISVMSEVSKSRITANYINTKLGISPAHISGPARTQIRVEYVREPRYRIYFSVDDTEIMNRLREMLVAHKSHFTPDLGTACCIAQVTW